LYRWRDILIGRKSRNFYTSHVFSIPRTGDPVKMFGTHKTRMIGYRVVRKH